MPLIIRQALAERIRNLSGMQGFLRDFRTATGIEVEFVGPLGHRVQGAPCSALCGLLQASPAGGRMCSRAMHQALEQAGAQAAALTCEAGLREVAVPLRAGGQTLGFLVFNGHGLEKPSLRKLNQVRHLLQREGVELPAAELAGAAAGIRLLTEEEERSLCRLLDLAASHLVLMITDNLSEPQERLPPLVQEACTLVRRSFTQELSLAGLARRLGVSAEHLCRVFHHSTGLHFREYVARMRAEHARRQLLASDKRVSEIAFAAGFQSLSQFNRRFRAIYGCTPQQLRAEGSR